MLEPQLLWAKQLRALGQPCLSHSVLGRTDEVLGVRAPENLKVNVESIKQDSGVLPHPPGTSTRAVEASEGEASQEEVDSLLGLLYSVCITHWLEEASRCVEVTQAIVNWAPHAGRVLLTKVQMGVSVWQVAFLQVQGP